MGRGDRLDRACDAAGGPGGGAARSHGVGRADRCRDPAARAAAQWTLPAMAASPEPAARERRPDHAGGRGGAGICRAYGHAGSPENGCSDRGRQPSLSARPDRRAACRGPGLGRWTLSADGRQRAPRARRAPSARRGVRADPRLSRSLARGGRGAGLPGDPQHVAGSGLPRVGRHAAIDRPRQGAGGGRHGRA